MKHWPSYAKGDSVNPDRLKAARLARKMDISDLALHLGVDPDLIEFWEDSFEQVPAAVVPELSAVLGFTEAFYYEWPACEKCGTVCEAAIPLMNSLVIHALNTKTPEQILKAQNKKLQKKIDALEKKLEARHDT